TLTFTDPPGLAPRLLRPNSGGVVRHSGAEPPPPNYTPPAPEEWVPGKGNFSGNWRRDLPDTPWRLLAPLQGPPGVTALAGQVLTTHGVPIAHISLHFEDSTESAETDATGRF